MRRTKSRVHAVLLENEREIQLYSLIRIKDVETEKAELSIRRVDGWRGGDGELLIETLIACGVAVRFFDKDEKVWKQATEDGITVVRGTDNGSWASPDVDEFEQEYLSVS